MVLTSDNYYLVVYSEKYNSMIHYRIDKMANVDVEKTDRIMPEWVNDFDLTKHKKQVFGMFVGEEKEVLIEFDSSLIDVVVDKFGEDVKLEENGDKVLMKAEVQISPQFISWVCSFGNKMKVVSPQDVVDKVKMHLEKMKELYEEGIIK